jgi:hypothetical protein
MRAAKYIFAGLAVFAAFALPARAQDALRDSLKASVAAQ